MTRIVTSNLPLLASGSGSCSAVRPATPVAAFPPGLCRCFDFGMALLASRGGFAGSLQAQDVDNPSCLDQSALHVAERHPDLILARRQHTAIKMDASGADVRPCV